MSGSHLTSSSRKSVYFLDSTTLIHAIDKNAAYHNECLDIVGKAAKGEIDAATSLETLEETLFMLSKITSLPIAIQAVLYYLRMSKIKKFEMSRTIFEHTLEIMEASRLRHPKDVINVATMLENGIAKIISEDKDYDKTNLIQRVHPKDF